MANVKNSHGDRQIWITRSHLAALALATFFIAVLSFFIGVQVGRTSAPDSTELAAPPLLPDADREQALEALLQEVEIAQAKHRLSFPETLKGESAPTVPLEAEPARDITAVAEPPTAPPPKAPPASSEPVPNEGWAVQVAAYDTPAEAEKHIAVLKDLGLKPYRTAVLKNGRTWYRVRVGGYVSRERAERALVEMESTMGFRDLIVATAP